MDKDTDQIPYEEIGKETDWIPLNQRESLSIFHIMGICCSMLAFQIAYSVEFALGTPIMSRLGIAQSVQSLIWFSGPLSGFIVQPLIGFYSDITMAKMGRRRPFIIVGVIGILLGFVLLLFVESLGNAMGKSESAKKGLKIFIFTLALLITNISINVLQGPSRTLVGDVVPKVQQVKANTVGSLMIGIAAIITNLIGGLDLATKLKLPFDNEKLIFIIGIVLIAIGVIITCVVAKEEPLRVKPVRANPLKEIFQAARNVPKPVLRIAIVFFFSWMAYYPFNIETTDFFGFDIYGGRSNGTDRQKTIYNDGVNFGMLVIAVSNVLVLIYGFFQEKVIQLVGMKLTYALSQIIEGICLVLVFFISNKWALMGIFAPLGISCNIFNSVPYAVVGMCVSQEQMGTYMGVLNSCCVVGQQISNFLLGSGIGALSPDWKAPILGCGSVFAFLSALLCFWIIVPEQQEQEMLEPLKTVE
ncbi:major facilitator superfamily transporter [Histomonas meleagridis]|uniref:major facilitator superfamily transporter n=1 Tax=Histomonas meleagridis TaxID=135588 RepID=UPI0035593B05|nr:major facilitator superfamily transporter [Histomonas meleagridis]KAH0803959.1 major facilitator superfamily transporter [Histomonas meleagridis]